MRCQFVAESLDAFRSARSGRPPAPVEELVSLGLVAAVEAFKVDPEEVSLLRLELAKIRSATMKTRNGIPSGAPPSETALAHLRKLQAEEASLRDRILTLSEKAMAGEDSLVLPGGRYALTYRGRDLLASLRPRLARVGKMELSAFEGEMASMAAAFEARARKAREILALLSPRFRDVEEIHLRTAAVGLAAREEPPQAVADAFASLLVAQTAASRSTSLLLMERRAVLAETLCLARPNLREFSANQVVQDLVVLWSSLEGEETLDGEDAMVAALVLVSFPPEERFRVKEEAQAFRAAATRTLGFHVPLAPAVLVARESGPAEERLDRFVALYQRLREASPPSPGFPPTPSSAVAPFSAVFADTPSPSTVAVPTLERPPDLMLAAAIFAITGTNGPDPLVARWKAAREFLGRFGEDRMAVPAAMLAVFATEVEESLENLRIASAQITKQKLSLGGMENLSLGMKIMTTVALDSAVPRTNAPGVLPLPPVEIGRRTALGLIGLAIPATAAMAAFTILHSRTLDRAALGDYRFYPSHYHYSYG